jgi:Xaa-Pro aminopeptidase
VRSEPRAIYRERVAGVRRGLAARGAAAAVFGLSSNLLYLTGFTDEPGERALFLIVPSDGEATMVVPDLYADQVEAHRPPATIRTWADGDDPARIVHEVADRWRKRAGSVLVDDSLWATFVLLLEEVFVGRSLGRVSDVVGPLRECKAPDEIGSMRKAGEIADRALEDALADPIVGLSERQLAWRLESAMYDHGAEGIAFETLVASGANSALPHYRAGSRRIEPRDVVILDFGCRCGGYCSDVTRTVVCGEATGEIEDAYGAVRRAHREAMERVRIGTAAESVDRAAREALIEAGFGSRFTHRTGHGVGLDVHEPPYIVEGNKDSLREGMALSIEPGAYWPGAFGVRLEDVVVVTSEGARPMTDASRTLRIVE